MKLFIITLLHFKVLSLNPMAVLFAITDRKKITVMILVEIVSYINQE